MSALAPDDLRCPQCLCDIITDKAGCLCTGCSRTWLVKEGICQIQDRAIDDFPRGELPLDLSNRLVMTAASGNWERAFEEILSLMDEAPAIYFDRYVRSDYRASFRLLVDLDPHFRILDYGCGWGAIACSLAPYVREIVGMDLASNRARFTAIRARQQGLENVRVLCAGDGTHLPFPDASFDLVLMNGVLEWLPSFARGHPGHIQLSRLRDVFRVLRTGGQAFIAIENRFWNRYWLGMPEVHTMQPWVSLLPRTAARLYSRLVWKKDFRVWTYSLGGYHRLFRKAGFSRVRVFQPMPEYNFPAEIIPLGSPAARRNASLDHSLKVPLLRRLHSFIPRLSDLIDRFVYTYWFVVGK